MSAAAATTTDIAAAPRGAVGPFVGRAKAEGPRPPTDSRARHWRKSGHIFEALFFAHTECLNSETLFNES